MVLLGGGSQVKSGAPLKETGCQACIFEEGILPSAPSGLAPLLPGSMRGATPSHHDALPQQSQLSGNEASETV